MNRPLEKPRSIAVLFKGGLDIPSTDVQFSSLRREHPIWTFDAPKRVTRWARAICCVC